MTPATHDVEELVRRGLVDAPTPAGLGLEADEVTRIASRALRRRRTGQGLLVGMATLAVATTGLWAGGWLPGEVQRVLPAAPWSSCALTWNGTGQDVRLADVDHAVVPLAGGGTVVAGVARGCPAGDVLFLAAHPGAPQDLPERLPLQGGLEDRPAEDRATTWLQGLRVMEGTEVSGGTDVTGRVDVTSGVDVTGVLLPSGDRDLTLVGPDAVHRPTTDPVPVPGTGLDVLVLEGYWPAGEEVATVRRDASGLVATDWGAGIIARSWDSAADDASRTGTWVAQDRQGQLWVMHDGEVRGPFLDQAAPWSVGFPAADGTATDVVVVGAEGGGNLSVGTGAGNGNGEGEDRQELAAEPLAGHEGDRVIHAVVVSLEGPAPGTDLPELTWTLDGGAPQVVRQATH